MSYVADLRTVIRRRDFRRLFGARLLSQLADGWFQVSLASLFFFSPEKQTTAHQVAAAFAVLLLPYSVVGPFAGVLLDRWRRRQVLVYSNAIRAVLVLVVAWVAASPAPTIVLYVAVLVTLSVNRFYLAGLSAALPHVVESDELVMANAVTPTSGTLAFTIGLGSGYLLTRLLGGDLRVLPLAAASYLASSAVAALLSRDQLGPDQTDREPARQAARRVVRGLGQAAGHVWERRSAGHALAAMTTMRFAYGLSVIAVILLERNTFNNPSQPSQGLASLAVVFAASGLGFFAAALVTPPGTRRVGTRGWVIISLAANAAVDASFAIWLNQPWVVVGAFLVGLTAQGVKICVDTIVQLAIADGFRGRVFAFYDVLYNAAFVAAAGIAALVVPSNGAAGWVYGTVGALYALSALGYTRASRRFPPPAREALPAQPADQLEPPAG